MTRDVLNTLPKDIADALAAGTAALATNTTLSEDREALALIAAKVPAVAKIEEQLRTTLHSKNAEALLGLSAMALQLRTLRAQPLAPKVQAPVPSRVPITTNAPAPLAEKLYRSLDKKGAEHERTRDEAITNHSFHDLRFLSAAAALIEDKAHRERAQNELLPSIGKAVGPFLRASYQHVDNEANVARLTVLATIDGAEALPLVRDAWEKSKGALKACALRCYATLHPTEAEAVALSVLETQKKAIPQLRAAAAFALRNSENPRVLELLFELLKETDEVSREAVEAIDAREGRAITKRLLALVPLKELKIPALSFFDPPKHLRGKKLDEAHEQFHEQRRRNTEKKDFVLRVLVLLGGRKEPEAETHLLQVLETKLPHDEINVAAGLGLARRTSPRARAAVLKVLHVRSRYHGLHEIAHRLLFLDPKTAFEKLAFFFDRKQLKRPHKRNKQPPEAIVEDLLYYWEESLNEPNHVDDCYGRNILFMLVQRSMKAPRLKEWFTDPRWMDWLFELADRRVSPARVLRILSKLAPERAQQTMIEAIERNEEYPWWETLSPEHTLVVAPLIAAINKQSRIYAKNLPLLHAAEKLRAPELVAPLRDWYRRLRFTYSLLARQLAYTYRSIARAPKAPR